MITPKTLEDLRSKSEKAIKDDLLPPHRYSYLPVSPKTILTLLNAIETLKGGLERTVCGCRYDSVHAVHLGMQVTLRGERTHKCKRCFALEAVFGTRGKE